MSKERIDVLTNDIEILNKLCLELDPYEPISKEQKMALKRFQIVDHYDPFKITNHLLVLLEDSIEELHKLQGNQEFIQ